MLVLFPKNINKKCKNMFLYKIFILYNVLIVLNKIIKYSLFYFITHGKVYISKLSFQKQTEHFLLD